MRKTMSIIGAAFLLGGVSACGDDAGPYEYPPGDPDEGVEQQLGEAAAERVEQRAEAAGAGPLDEELQEEQAEIRTELRHEAAGPDDEGFR